MRVLVVAEFYPRAADPVLGVWAHRQALAARDAGADVRVVILHRPLPPAARASELRAWREATAQPARATLDGLAVRYVRYLSPPRGADYARWGSYAAPALALALRRLRRTFPYDLVHAHYAVPAADAVLRAGGARDVPLVISEHGGDVFHTVNLPGGRARVTRAFAAARLVLANSAGIERAVRALGAQATRVVHLGTDIAPPTPTSAATAEPATTLVTVGHLVARKRHADVVQALAALRDKRPRLRYRIVGDGPEREPLRRLAAELGVADRVELVGALAPEAAVRAGRDAALFVMPSTEEAFGVAYVEAMAGGVPAIGAAGEPGPQEIAVLGDGGMRLVTPGDVEALAQTIDALLDPDEHARAGAAARATVEQHFTWEHCGAETVAAYEEALR